MTAVTPQRPGALPTSFTAPRVHIKQTIPALSREVNNQVEHTRMDRMFDQNGITTFIDVAIVTPFSSSPGLIAAASARPGNMEKIKFERYPLINLVLSLMKGADNPSLVIRYTQSVVQAISKQQLTAATT